MKIGILTYHRTHNYGGCLQALATRLFLEEMGHEVYYVDYWPEHHKRLYSIFNKDNFMCLGWKGKIRYIQSILLSFPYLLKRQRLFELYHKEYTYKYCKPLNEQYDVIIYGSDQIWAKQKALNDYDAVYFGVNAFQAQKHISYAASMGLIPEKEEEGKSIASMLKKLDVISVRESSLKWYLESLGLRNIFQTIDPTLLLDVGSWDKVSQSQPYNGRKYILIYALWGDVFDINSINALAERENLIVKTLRGNALKKETETEISLVDPIEFLRLIKNAEYVFSSSFHGLVFSVIFHKQVYASFKLNGKRAQSLLEALGISDRYLENNQILPSQLSYIDYEKVDQKLNGLRKVSMDFLRAIND